MIAPNNQHDSFSAKKSFPQKPRCAIKLSKTEELYCFALDQGKLVILNLSVPDNPETKGTFNLTEEPININILKKFNKSCLLVLGIQEGTE